MGSASTVPSKVGVSERTTTTKSFTTTRNDAGTSSGMASRSSCSTTVTSSSGSTLSNVALFDTIKQENMTVGARYHDEKERWRKVESILEANPYLMTQFVTLTKRMYVRESRGLVRTAKAMTEMNLKLPVEDKQSEKQQHKRSRKARQNKRRGLGNDLMEAHIMTEVEVHLPTSQDNSTTLQGHDQEPANRNQTPRKEQSQITAAKGQASYDSPAIARRLYIKSASQEIQQSRTYHRINEQPRSVSEDRGKKKKSLLSPIHTIYSD